MITCRVWILTVLRKLVDEGFVHCDIGVLEKDCLEVGNEHSATASANEQPRPVVKSRVSSCHSNGSESGLHTFKALIVGDVVRAALEELNT